MLRLQPPHTEGIVWKQVLTCALCGTTRLHCNDTADRVHIVRRSAAAEARLALRRKKRRTKLNLEHLDGAKIRKNHHGRGIHLLNLQLVASKVLHSMGWSDYANGAALIGDLYIPQRTFERLSGILWSAAERAALRVLSALVKAVVKEGKPIGLSADGAWNKRREALKHVLAFFLGKLPILVVTIEKTIRGTRPDGTGYVVFQGNYDGSSKGMETAAWQRVAALLDAIDTGFRPLVHWVCVDRDNSVPAILNVCFLPLLFHCASVCQVDAIAVRGGLLLGYVSQCDHL
jgi:hypothetical protein